MTSWVIAMDLIADLEARGLVHVATDLDALAGAPGGGADSALLRLRPDRRQPPHRQPDRPRHPAPLPGRGHTAIALAGGATGMVGDPERTLRRAQPARRRHADRNVAAIKQQISRIVDLDGERGELVDNRDWTAPITYLEFLRDVGRTSRSIR